MEKTSDSEPKILFVCLGNICRSPMAEGAFRDAAEKAGLTARVDSAGTAAYHIDEPPDPRAIATARANGVDISGARGRQLNRADFFRFTHIVALDNANLTGIKAHAPRDGTAKLSLLLDAVSGRKGEAVEDPYYGNEEDFERAWEGISEAVAAMAKRFDEEGSDAQF